MSLETSRKVETSRYIVLLIHYVDDRVSSYCTLHPYAQPNPVKLKLKSERQVCNTSKTPI